ncbi:MAG: EF-P lysine aminoacylase GenX [Gammaproteobacteria bacterium RIFCSPHIGHO2_12_FULL_37_14]|nr:MAG: EF-P lysine aminoacylase GenX [Gammaproteobacteria bacterium RIFCSPHIGHO2_12_FULL_37_14]
MSHARKNKPTWQPSASLEHLRFRATILTRIRDFFSSRDILAVETPLLCQHSVTDPHIQSISASLNQRSAASKIYYLQTSPEYAMKRLLAAGCGAIYQITKAFRQDEIGHLHNPEFTLLEWYRPGFDHHHLMNEVDVFLQTILNTTQAIRLTYQALFQRYLNIDPHHATLAELQNCADQQNIHVHAELHDRDAWLNILMTHCIEPQLGKANQPCFVYHFPITQAALARIQPGVPPVAERFEVYVEGIELANGFHELQDAAEQRQRFEKNIAERRQAGLTELTIDEHFLAALTHGLPDCSGVALGIDRLIMLAINSKQIADVLSFDFSKV